MAKYVIFTENNARIFYRPDHWWTNGVKGAVKDPDLTAVRRVPPHYWNLTPDGIRAMTCDEMRQRDAHHKAFGVDNGEHHFKEVQRYYWPSLLLVGSLFFAFGYFFGRVIH